MDEIELTTECTTSIKWKISDFSTKAAHDDPKKEMTSRDFQLGTSGIICYLGFYPTNRKPTGDKNYSSLYLCIRDYGAFNDVKLCYKLWLENESGRRIQQYELSRLFKKSRGNGRGYSMFVHQDQLYSPLNNFVKNDTVYICCKITRENELPAEPPKLDVEFRQNLWSAYNDGLVDSCCLQVGGEEIKVSKTILTAQSDVFKVMFSSASIEAQTSSVKITDSSVNAIRAMIEFLHLGTVSNLDANAEELFQLADKYNIENLQKLSTDNLIDTLSDENIKERIILAFKHNEKRLKSATLEYVTKASDSNIFTKVFFSDEWYNFGLENRALASEISKTAAKMVFERKK